MKHQAAAAALAFLVVPAAATAEPAFAPSFGLYHDDTTTAYDGYVRSSQYVATRDGTRLAVDLYLPTRGGVVASEKLPVIWTFTPYNRAVRQADGSIAPPYGYGRLLANGYAVAIADLRGRGLRLGCETVLPTQTRPMTLTT